MEKADIKLISKKIGRKMDEGAPGEGAPALWKGA
jgi:hypothetical protein